MIGSFFYKSLTLGKPGVLEHENTYIKMQMGNTTQQLLTESVRVPCEHVSILSTLNGITALFAGT